MSLIRLGLHQGLILVKDVSFVVGNVDGVDDDLAESFTLC